MWNPNSPWVSDIGAWEDSDKRFAAGRIFSPAVEKMRERGFWLKLTGPFSPKDERESMRLWNAGLTEHGFTGWNSRPPFRGKHAEAPMAICLALVAATGGS